MALIEIEKGNPEDIGKKTVLGESIALIGRGTTGSDPDIKLRDEYISRRHAEIHFDQDCYLIRDLNSTNGTSIDEIRLEPGKFYTLKDDSLIGLGIVAGVPRVLLRFKQSPTQKTRRFEGPISGLRSNDWLRVDELKNEIWVDGRSITFSRKEYDLVLCLYKKMGKVCHRDEIIAGVWPEVIDPGGISDAAIDQLIHRLRLKIEADPSHPKRLLSRKGFGYMLEPDTTK